MTVVSRVKPAGSKTSVVETRVVATSMDTLGTGARQACTSTGRLEVRVHEAAKTAVAAQ